MIATAAPVMVGGQGSGATCATHALSRRQSIVHVVRVHAMTRGYALTLDEVRDAMAAEGLGIPDTLAAEMSSLKRTRDLVGTWSGACWRYAPPGFVATATPPLTESEMVLQAVVIACAHFRRMVSTHEVNEAMRAKGWCLDSDTRHTARSQETALRHRLATLARVRTTGRQGAMNRPALRREDQAGAGGRTHTFWAPAGQPGLALPKTAASASELEAGRTAVRDAVALAGRPLSRSEIALYVMQLPASDPVRRALADDGSRPRIARVLRQGRREAGGVRIAECRTPWTAAGGAPVRYELLAADTAHDLIAHGVLVLDDALAVWRLDRESARLHHLERRLSVSDRRVLSPLLDARRGALASCLEMLSTMVSAPLEESLTRAEAADATILAWARGVVGLVDTPSMIIRAVDERRQGRRALVSLMRQRGTTVEWNEADVQSIVGIAGVSTLDELTVFAPGLVDMERDGAVARALEGCRRLPNEAGHEYANRLGWHHGLPKVPILDRAEALSTLGASVPDAWTRVLVARAYDLLGDLLRAPAIVCEVMLLAAADRRVSSGTRHALVLAASMLGAGTALETAVAMCRAAVTDADAGDTMRAAMLAMLVANPHDASAHMQSIVTMPGGRQAAIVRRAMTRVRYGFILSAAAA